MFHKILCRAACAVILGGAVAQSAAAAGFLYDCTMENPEAARGWVSPKIAIVLPDDGTVRIIDALTITFADEPVSGTILRDNAARLIVKWSLRNVRADSGRSFAHFDYRASISKKTGRIELTAGPRTFDTGLRGAGTCTKRTE